jgi:hypothetical protein
VPIITILNNEISIKHVKRENDGFVMMINPKIEFQGNEIG